jgi:hypothetical protein
MWANSISSFNLLGSEEKNILANFLQNKYHLTNNGKIKVTYKWWRGSRGSLVSIVFDYGVDNWVIEVRSPADVKGFFLYPVCPGGSGAHPASCPMGTGGPFPGCKTRLGHETDHSPHLVPRSWMSRSYTSSPSPKCFTFYKWLNHHQLFLSEK